MSKCLRPHHGMCFQFYEGRGYLKSAFCANANEYKAEWEKASND